VLRVGDQLRVGRLGTLRFAYAGNRYRVRWALVRLVCRDLLVAAGHPTARVLALRLQAGFVSVRAGQRSPRRAVVLTPEALAVATARGSAFEVRREARARSTRARAFDQPIAFAAASSQTLRLTARPTYSAIADAAGLRLDVWPFSLPAGERAPVAADALVPFWDDGRSCSVGCPPPGGIPGWPLRPFHSQHAIRSGLNELRPANFHVALDIEAPDFAPVYPISSGYVRVVQGSGPDERVQVGRFTYWHIDRRVSEGQYVRAYSTVLGTVKYAFKHIAFSESLGGRYLNSLRPGGRVLAPWSDTEAPVVGVPEVFSDGSAIVEAFDPQSFVSRASYETPVLAPAALAWRLFDSGGRAIGGLHWALRGSQHYPDGLKPTIFAPGAGNPGFNCFFKRVLCIPTWRYWLAGGLTARLPLAGLPAGSYRLSVYAWDWAGNVSAIDTWLRVA
jgi:murein DD-endopeptidase MepM/ murein hydrolase activator NlpD